MAKITYIQNLKPELFPGYENLIREGGIVPKVTVDVEFNESYTVTGIQIGGYIDILTYANWPELNKCVKDYAAKKVAILKPYPPDETEEFENDYYHIEAHDREAVAIANTYKEDNS